MPSYFPPKKNAEYIFYISLVSQADTKLMQNSPTIAAGDFQVSTDGGTLGNLTTLPAVTPASSDMVKITLSATEMNGDNVTVVCSDAAGAEWCDQVINIQTAARQLDDLAYPTTTGRSIDVTATGAVGIDWANVENQSTAVDLSATDIQLCDTITTYTGNTVQTGDAYAIVNTMGIKKNTAFNNLEFNMVLSSDHYTAATGKSITMTRSIDGGAFAAKDASTTLAEVGNGIYQADLAAADTNGDVITYRFTAASCDDTFITVKTRS